MPVPEARAYDKDGRTDNESGMVPSSLLLGRQSDLPNKECQVPVTVTHRLT